MPRNHKSIELSIREYMTGKQNMGNLAAEWSLKRLGIITSVKTISNIRNKYEIPYVKDSRIHNTVMVANRKGIPLTEVYLKHKLPQICQDYVDYLLYKYAAGDRGEIPPFKVGGIAGVVTQILLAA